MFDLTCGVPQGSCLGPFLFIVYASDLFRIVDRHLPHCHAFADDTQFYQSFKPGCAIDASEATDAMQAFICDIQKWLVQNKMKMNDDKNEFLLIGTRQQLAKQSMDHLFVGNVTITPAISVKNRGIWMDSKLLLETQIKSIFFSFNS